jgi:hypothetical protein
MVSTDCSLENRKTILQGDRIREDDTREIPGHLSSRSSQVLELIAIPVEFV